MARQNACMICGNEAAYARSATGFAGVVTRLVCDQDECDRQAVSLIREETVEQAARRINPARRRLRAGQLERAARRLASRSDRLYRESAGLHGASSLTHAYGLHAAIARQQADHKLALARYLRAQVDA